MTSGLHVRTNLSRLAQLPSRREVPAATERAPRPHVRGARGARAVLSTDDSLGRWEVDGGRVVVEG